MLQQSQFPKHVTRIAPGTTFSFSCHRGVTCFTECCRLLELALTPFDVLRLRKGTGIHSAKLLEQYIIIEHKPGEPFPQFYLTMVDDGRASCVFVDKTGCTIYNHRPGACRTYPLGRAVVNGLNNVIAEDYILMKESHCRGFAEKKEQHIVKYSRDQGLEEYNRFNDAVASILQHDTIRNGFLPSKKQANLYTLALYDIDTFREKLFSDEITSLQLGDSEKKILENDEQLIDFAIKWLYKKLYSIY
jgi:Fe-S-cluster containining protein